MTSSRDVFLVFFPSAHLVCSYQASGLRLASLVLPVFLMVVQLQISIILLFEVLVLKNIFHGAISVWWD